MNIREKVFAIVKRIPIGKVAYYKQIAEIIALEHQEIVSAQVVGWMLSGMQTSEFDLIPWQRVVAKNGYIAALKLGSKGLLQIELLQKEGIVVIDNTIDIHKYCVSLDDLINF